MSIVRKEFASKVFTNKCYTSFKWNLEDYSILQSYYGKFIESPEFDLAETDKQCSLGYEHGGDEIAYAKIYFPQGVNFHSLKIVISIVDEYNRKFLTRYSVANKPLEADETMSYTTFKHPLLATDKIIKRKGILHNDTLSLFCEITIIKSVNKSSIEVVEPAGRSDDTMREKCAEYLNQNVLCDVTFHVDDMEFYAHKVVLAANSPVFEAMFSTPMTEQLNNIVTITDTDATTFAAFLKCLYTRSVHGMKKHIGDIMILADKYQVDSMKNLCENYIKDHLDRDNVIDYLLLAHLHGFQSLKIRALLVAQLCQKDLADSTEFAKLCVYPDLVAEIFHKVIEI